MRLISAADLTRVRDPESAHAQTPALLHAVSIRVAGVTMELRTNLRDLASALAEQYEDHVTHAAADFPYYVAQTPDGYVFWCAHAGAYRWMHGALPIDAVLFLCDAVLLAALVQFDADLASVHAAALDFHGVTFAITGDSTAGKTTTTLACARAGMRIYSDERALLRGTIVHPFVRRLRPRPDCAARLRATCDSDALARALAQAQPLSLRACFGEDAIAQPRPLRALFVLDGYASRSQMTRIDASRALPAISQWFDASGDCLARLARAMKLLRGIDCYRLVLGPPHDAAHTIASVLASQQYAATRL